MVHVYKVFLIAMTKLHLYHSNEIFLSRRFLVKSVVGVMTLIDIGRITQDFGDESLMISTLCQVCLMLCDVLMLISAHCA